jgi:uncharacterized membrane protein
MRTSNTESQIEKLHQQELKSELAISRVLRYGALISTLIMAAGVVLRAIRGHGAVSGAGFVHLPELLPHVLRMEPIAVTELGVLLLLLTPVARIVVTMITFAVEHDMKYMLISLGVLAVVLFSIAFAIEA